MSAKKVGIWLRVSTDRQAQGDSPEIHERRARMYAESKGWEVYSVYHLEGISGKSVSEKQETQRMLQDIHEGNIDGLIFSKLARFARNVKELIEFADLFEAKKATLVSLQESIDTSTAAGRLFYIILAAMAQWEREETVERIKASNATRRSMGKMAGGMASYGFTIVDGKLTLNSEEAPIRKLMYELFLDHKRFKVVAEKLNERGYLSRKGKSFSGTSIARLLANTDAKGIHRSNYKGVPTKDNPTGYKPKEEWVFNTCPRIVSDELWDEVNSIIEYQKSNNKNARPMNRRVNLFTGYLYCHNDHKMTIQSKAKSYSCKHCKIKIGKDDIEDIFKTRLKAFVNSPEEREEYQNSARGILDDKRKEIASIDTTLKEIEEKMNQLLELHLEKKIPTQGFDKHYNPLFEQSEKLGVTRVKLEKELQQLQFTASNFNELINHSHGLYDTWDTLNRPERRAIIESMTNRIEFNGEEIVFKLKKLPPLKTGEGLPLPSELTPNGSRSGTPLKPGGSWEKLFPND